MNTKLPTPDAEASAHSASLSTLIKNTIDSNEGWIDFAHYMELALYAPGLGYYSGGAKKFGQSGDFVTAPEISPLFAQTLARQVAQVIQAGHHDVLELGAGTGRLALELLTELEKLNQLPERYLIMEVSAHLRGVQQETLATHLPSSLYAKVQWLDTLPENFSGVVLGNEVLDALPVHIVKTTEQGMIELGVAYDQNGFHWAERVLTNPYLKKFVAEIELPTGYTTEVCLAASGFLSSLCAMLDKGLIILVDYGFPRREYYHPQRSQGTLMCHYRHYSHNDPFYYPGLQDITAHVDFSYVAQTALANGVNLKGYCGQAQFLINCGITELLSRVSPHDMAAYVPLASQAQKLLSPAEMGELFKLIAFTKSFDEDLIGFNQGDKSHTL
ncbi:MAG: SAM-dependent methyltransferase [Methylophilaceae bacterium]|nr:SAM-dependent methyltransferase [Methylophilaceae bacterium]